MAIAQLSNRQLHEACLAFHSRELNHGTWPQGVIPTILEEIRDEHYPYLKDDFHWTRAIEAVVQCNAVREIATRPAWHLFRRRNEIE